MREADAIRDRAPVKAAGLAQLAVAIAILSVFSVRLGNLGTIRIGENLIRTMSKTASALRPYSMRTSPS